LTLLEKRWSRGDSSLKLGAMSTIVTGEAKDVFVALHEAFDRVAATGHVVMTVTVSNAFSI
jgi:uncharacterized protein YqgV (UPF0045/DUF77 family)